MLKLSIYLLCFCLLLASCKKEAALQPSNLEENMMVIKDNPNDPTDHALYQFYVNTGMPCFYNDTIGKREVSETNGIKRYAYTRLMLAYSTAQGRDSMYRFTLPADKSKIVPLLDLLKTDVLPRLPKNRIVFSILFLDELEWKANIILPGDPEYKKLNAYSGFNTLGLRIVNPDTFTEASRKEYIGSILAQACFRKLNNTPEIDLRETFYSISRTAFGNDIYNTEFTSWFPPDQQRLPEEFGLILYYPIWGFIITPEEQDDLNAFLKAVFIYSTAEFTALYHNYPVTVQKFRVLKDMVRKAGFEFND